MGTQTVEAGTCFAWNPSISGTKSEDTIFLNPLAAEPEVLTVSPDWPMVYIKVPDGRGMYRADILERKPERKQVKTKAMKSTSPKAKSTKKAMKTMKSAKAMKATKKVK